MSTISRTPEKLFMRVKAVKSPPLYARQSSVSKSSPRSRSRFIGRAILPLRSDAFGDGEWMRRYDIAR